MHIVYDNDINNTNHYSMTRPSSTAKSSRPPLCVYYVLYLFIMYSLPFTIYIYVFAIDCICQAFINREESQTSTTY